MSELLPIIERLDAEIPQGIRFSVLQDEPRMWKCDDETKQAASSLFAKYGELRAELLRLQEERDQEAKARVQRGVQVIELKAERDALLEALKPLLAGPPVYRDHGGTDFRTCGYCHNPIEDYNHQHADWCPWERVHGAIASMEGKDE